MYKLRTRPLWARYASFLFPLHEFEKEGEKIQKNSYPTFTHTKKNESKRDEAELPRKGKGSLLNTYQSHGDGGEEARLLTTV